MPDWNWIMLHLIIDNFLSKIPQIKHKPKKPPKTKKPFEWECGAIAGIFKMAFLSDVLKVE